MTPKQAYSIVHRSIKNGTLIRPDCCCRCGANGSASDGRTLIQAHHSDYNNPLDVEWLCAKCHKKETPLPKIIGAPNYGENNGYSKLTEKLVSAIRASNKTNRELGVMYGVSHTTIGRAKNGVYWKLAAAPKKGE